ncbi:MAG: ACT domain-containing protein [Chloroherpetonaceae bacterium]|nr:ACT domain-containing protein [Chloroherpetonaceae bacterium]
MGETNLHHLLRNLSPVLLPDAYFFISLPKVSHELLALQPFAIIQETEGTTLVVNEQSLEALKENNHIQQISAPYRAIKLSVHSSLEAVGLTAAVSSALAKESIAANIIAGFYHDYCFVPALKANEAIQILEKLQQQPKDKLT